MPGCACRCDSRQYRFGLRRCAVLPGAAQTAAGRSPQCAATIDPKHSRSIPHRHDSRLAVPHHRPVTAGGARLARFLTIVGLVDLALTANEIIDYVIDKFIVRPAWWRQFEDSYIERQEAIDEQVKERLKECARLQVEFNLGGGTAAWGGNRSWDIYYTSFGTGGTVVFTLPRLRQGIVTVHQVSNGN